MFVIPKSYTEIKSSRKLTPEEDFIFHSTKTPRVFFYRGLNPKRYWLMKLLSNHCKCRFPRGMQKEI